MEILIQQALNAVVLGSIYCLVASGLTLVYGVMHIPYFAQGNVYMAAAYAVYFFLVTLGFNFWVTCLLVIVLFMFIGAGVELLCFRPVRNAPHINSFTVAIGLLMVIEGAIILLFGADYKEVPAQIILTLEVSSITISAQRITVILGTAIIMISLHLFLKKTQWGMCLEAMSQNGELATMLGIKINRMSMIAFIISGVLASLGGLLMAPLSFVYPAMGVTPLLISFAAVIFGGMGSLPGAVVGSFVMAFAQVFTTHFVASTVEEVGIFAMMILILIFLPKGIMGSAQ